MSITMMAMQDLAAATQQQAGHVAAVMPAADGNNPFSGVKPNWSALGSAFNSKWTVIAGVAWALALAATGLYFLRGFVSYAQHRNGNHPTQVAEAQQDLKQGGAAFAGVVMFGVIIGAVIAVFG